MSFRSESDAQIRQFNRYLVVARERWWIVAVVAAAFAVVALAISLLQTPMYKSTATLYVTSGTTANSQNAYQGSLASQQRVDSYVRLVKSDAVLSDAIRYGDVAMTIDDARKAVSANAAPDTVLLNVVAVRDSSASAAALANAVASSMTRYVASLERPSASEVPLAKVTVVTPAVPAASPFSPSIIRNILLGLFIGIIAGLLFLLARARFDNKIRDEADIETITGQGPLTLVAVDGSLHARPLADFESGSSLATEAYRRLRTNVAFASVDQPACKLLVSSPGEGEGKTTTAINLAASLAEAGGRVVLVDADLRKPAVADRLNVAGAVGLTDCLRDGLPVASLVQRSDMSGLDILPSGQLPPNPAELLGSQRARDVLDVLGGAYDFVIVDSPPILPVTDACVLSQWVDGTIVVIRAGRTKRPDLISTLTQLSKAKALVLGTVVNAATVSGKAYRYGYYGDRGTASAGDSELASESSNSLAGAELTS